MKAGGWYAQDPPAGQRRKLVGENVGKVHHASVRDVSW